MDITKFDKNFAAAAVEKDGKRRFDLPCAPFKLYGGMYEEGAGFVRMPLGVAAGVSAGVHFLAGNGAGLRLNFRTNSKTLRLYVRVSFFCRMRHMALTGSTGVILCSREGAGYKNVPPVLYYGSSITQGGCASRADTSYEDLICERTGADYINLGFSGNGKAEDNMVDYLRGIDCSVFVCDYDHNAPTPEYLAKTHERLYKRYREVKKDTPIVFVTRPEARRDCADARQRAEIIYATYENALKNGDKNVYFVDGREFFPEGLRERCQVDGCHPTDLGFYYMAEKIGGVVAEILQKSAANKADGKEVD